MRAFVFPGQGAQTIGMGRELAEAYPAARAVFDEVDEALGERLSALIWEGDADTLTLTQHPEQRTVQRLSAQVELGQVGVPHDDAVLRRGVVGLDHALHQIAPGSVAVDVGVAVVQRCCGRQREVPRA